MSSDEQQIRALVDAWTKATKEGDVDAVLNLMADDVVFLVCGRPPMRGKAVFEAAARVHSPTAARPLRRASKDTPRSRKSWCAAISRTCGLS